MDILHREEQMEQPGVNFVAEGVKIGVINGLFAMLLLYVSYYMGMDAFINMQVFGKFIPYMIIVLVIYGFQLRKRNGGYLPFKEAIKYTFLSYVIAAIITAIGTYILFNLIDPQLTGKLIDASMEKLRRLAEAANASDADTEKMMETLEKTPRVTGVRNILFGMGTNLIWDFLVSLLISLVIRKEKPLFN